MIQAAFNPVFAGVDVGTGSARVGLFDRTGRLLATARHPIQTWYLPGDIVEQSSEDIWQSCRRAMAGALAKASVAPARIAGIGFDATCSLVAIDSGGRALSVSPQGDPQRNVIVWMDHRAVDEAATISLTGDPALRHMGGHISPEMQTPKLLWLKRHAPKTYAAAEFFDLADYLSFRATGSRTRSLCTLTCKWTFAPRHGGWNERFFRRIGLHELLENRAARIGSEVAPPGSLMGNGLQELAASDFGLHPGIAVGASLIDAYAGAIATIGGPDPNGEQVAPTARAAYIFGSSACVMAMTHQATFIPGLWGPYDSAIIPGLWINEGGQSAAGIAIDTLVQAHPCYRQASAAAHAAGLDTLTWLEQRILKRVGDASHAALLARSVHVVPDFLGNRSPDADHGARGMLAGLAIDHDLEGLEVLLIAGLCGIGYGLAAIIDALHANGVGFDTMVMSGGGGHSTLVRQLIADTTGVPIQLSACDEPVLLGAAMLGAVAGGTHEDIPAAMRAMSRTGSQTAAAAPEVATFHRAKRAAYMQMKALDQQLRAIMRDATSFADAAE